MILELSYIMHTMVNIGYSNIYINIFIIVRENFFIYLFIYLPKQTLAHSEWQI